MKKFSNIKDPAVVVRPAAPADLPAVGRLGALLVRTHHDFDPQRFIAATPQTERGYASFLGGQLAAPNVVVLVAERGGEVLGYTYAADRRLPRAPDQAPVRRRDNDTPRIRGGVVCS
jgi:hypothetical protein